MDSIKIKLFALSLLLAFLPAITALAEQKKATVGLELYVNPVLYSEVKDGRLVFENNYNEEISIYGDDRLIYSATPSSGTNDFQISDYPAYSSFIIIPTP